MICSAHLINDGVTVVGNSVTVEWQGTGPSQSNRNTQFNCILHSETRQSCKIFVYHFPFTICLGILFIFFLFFSILLLIHLYFLSFGIAY